MFGQNSGSDTITDFTKDAGTNNEDRIDLTAFAYAGFSAVSISNNGDGNAVIDLGPGNDVTLLGVTAEELDAADFVL